MNLQKESSGEKKSSSVCMHNLEVHDMELTVSVYHLQPSRLGFQGL